MSDGSFDSFRFAIDVAIGGGRDSRAWTNRVVCMTYVLAEACRSIRDSLSADEFLAFLTEPRDLEATFATVAESSQDVLARCMASDLLQRPPAEYGAVKAELRARVAAILYNDEHGESVPDHMLTQVIYAVLQNRPVSHDLLLNAFEQLLRRGVEGLKKHDIAG